MLFLKAVIFTMLTLFVSVFAFFFYTFDSNYQINNALDAFLKEEYSEAKRILDHLEGEAKSSDLALYRAYIFRATKEMKEADEQLELALSISTDRHLSSEKFFEIYLNQAYNALLLSNEEAFSNNLRKAEKENSKHSLTRFFLGIEAFLREDYAKAFRIWKEPFPLNYLSGWMKGVFDKRFTQNWKILHLARCQIEEGQYLLARKSLEDISKNLSREEELEEAFLIGLSYIKEAESKPLVASMPYYQVALSYFDQVPVNHKRFAKEQARLARQLEEIAKLFVEQKNFENVSFFVNVLENWGAKEHLENVSKKISILLEQEIKSGHWESAIDFATVLNRLLKIGQIRQQVSERFHGLLEIALTGEDLSQLEYYWQISLLLSSSPGELIEKTSTNVGKKILETVLVDQADLEKTLSYTSYWMSIERDGQRRFLFAKQLAMLASDLWSHKGDEVKAFNTMKLAETLVNAAERPMMQRFIVQELKNTYVLAAQEDDIEKLSTLYDAAKYFRIESFGIEEKNEIANQLEDAIYLVKVGRLLEAERRLAWILKVEEKPQARRLLGIVKYRQEDFEGALKILRLLPRKDKEVREIIAICQIVSGEEEAGKKALEKLANQQTLNDHSYFHLGYLDLIQGHMERGLKWLRKIQQPDEEMLVYLCIASYQNQDWRAAIDYYHQLSNPYDRLLSMQVLVFRSFVSLKKNDLAKTVLTRILESKKEESQLLPKRFQKLSAKILETPERLSLAGEFYLYSLQDDEKALEYFSKIEEPLLKDFFHKGEIHYRLGNLKESEWLFLQVTEQNDDELLKQQAMLALARLFSAQQEINQSLFWYKRYFDKNKKDLIHRREYIRILTDVMQWKNALEQFQIIRNSSHSLQGDEMISYLLCLLQMGKNDELIGQVEAIWSEGRGMTSLNRLKLLRMMFKVHATELFKGILESLGDMEGFGVLEKRELIALYTDSGQYERAKPLILEVSDKLESEVDGLMVLAKFYKYTQDLDKARSLVKKAFGINPQDVQVRSMLFELERDLTEIERYKGVYEKQVKESEKSMLAKLGLYRMMLGYTLQAKKQEKIHKKNFHLSLQKIRSNLETLADRYKFYPEVFYLLGLVFYEEDNDIGAQHAFELALRQNPSYIQVYKILARSYERVGEKQKAIESLEKLLGFSPNDLESWGKLAGLHLEGGGVEKARNSLMQAKRFSLPKSTLHNLLNDMLLEIPISDEMHGEEMTQALLGNIKTFNDLLLQSHILK